ncbi:methyltransferase, TIGR04325 family [Campylobacter hyointestinalis subsp. hyointestinalis]|nr:methyltransferase, TIGR04325 family [Campylobacter hyointestinalis subsp. hyointestinalis]PPB66240.1 methyltransferase, TIGR04325 family [Campylobacter hyointestinalis subsp. hyointestinalis]
MLISCRRGIKVIDFGGSLGFTYFQNKKFLDRLFNLSWNIVEQKEFVDVGKAKFSDERLKFYYDIKNCINEQKSDVLLISSALQYIKKPYDLLNGLLTYNFEFISFGFGRTTFSINNKDTIKLQKLPPNIYKASYPCWFFSENNFLSFFKNRYESIEQFDALDGCTKDYSFWLYYVKN